jgi:hypothetical protein
MKQHEPNQKKEKTKGDKKINSKKEEKTIKR